VKPETVIGRIAVFFRASFPSRPWREEPVFSVAAPWRYAPSETAMEHTENAGFVS